MASTAIDRLDGLSSSTAVKGPCRVATTANITLSGLQTIDGVALAADDRVLVKNQTDTVDNGIYIASVSGWRRSRDFYGARDVTKGTRVTVTDGSTLGGREYRVTTSNPIVVGTSNIVFAETLSSDSGSNAAAAAASAAEAAASAAVLVIEVADGAALQALLDATTDGEVIVGSNVTTSDTIVVPSGVRLTIRPGCSIIPDDDFDVVRLHGSARFEGTIDVSGVTWDSVALLYDGSSEQSDSTAFRLGRPSYAKANLIGKTTGTGNGTAIGMICDGKDSVVSGATQANPVEITSTAHPFATGDIVYITSVGGMTEINDRYFTITKTGTDTFTLNSEDGTGHTGYTSGGTIGYKSWLMAAHIDATVKGFDKALHMSDGGAGAWTFNNSHIINIDANYPLQSLVMETGKSTGYGNNGNTIRIKSQSRATADQTSVPLVLTGQLNVMELLQWDWAGGGGGTVKAMTINAGCRDNYITTWLAPTFITNNATARSNIINNLLNTATGLQVNDIAPYLAALRIRAADLRLDSAKALMFRNAADNAEWDAISTNSGDDLLITGYSGAGDNIIVNAGNNTGGIFFRRFGANIMAFTQNLRMFFTGEAGGTHEVTIKNSRTGAKTVDFLAASGDIAIIGAATAANIAAVGNAINTSGKAARKLVWDTTNNRLMVASGAAAADAWYVADGSASVTPA